VFVPSGSSSPPSSGLPPVEWDATALAHVPPDYLDYYNHDHQYDGSMPLTEEDERCMPLTEEEERWMWRQHELMAREPQQSSSAVDSIAGAGGGGLLWIESEQQWGASDARAFLEYEEASAIASELHAIEMHAFEMHAAEMAALEQRAAELSLLEADERLWLEQQMQSSHSQQMQRTDERHEAERRGMERRGTERYGESTERPPEARAASPSAGVAAGRPAQLGRSLSGGAMATTTLSASNRSFVPPELRGYAAKIGLQQAGLQQPLACDGLGGTRCWLHPPPCRPTALMRGRMPVVACPWSHARGRADGLRLSH
jgi:hypothetical protein